MDLNEIIMSMYDHTTDPDRPFTGQPHTDQRERGKQEVTGLRMKDIADCIAIGMAQASHPNKAYELSKQGMLNYNDLYDINFSELDPVAIIQNAMCQIEKRMGIFPNTLN